MFRRLIASTLILPFLIVPLFCCCVKTAQAATATAQQCHGDDGNTPAHHPGTSGHSHATCDCHSFSTAAENGSTIHPIAVSIENTFSPVQSIAPGFAAFAKGSMRMAYLGPPGGPSAVPFYTLYHSLRI